jgi:hypothetical protein
MTSDVLVLDALVQSREGSVRNGEARGREAHPQAIPHAMRDGHQQARL